MVTDADAADIKRPLELEFEKTSVVDCKGTKTVESCAHDGLHRVTCLQLRRGVRAARNRRVVDGPITQSKTQGWESTWRFRLQPPKRDGRWHSHRAVSTVEDGCIKGQPGAGEAEESGRHAHITPHSHQLDDKSDTLTRRHNTG